MGMIQIDMQMPTVCGECPFLDESGDYPYCIVLQESRGYTFRIREKRFKNCPLKEQEAVEPTLVREGRNKYCNDYVCPLCDNEVVYEQNYCSECGVPFSWEVSVKFE